MHDSNADDVILVRVKESVPDFASGQYRVILQDTRSDKTLAIWVGQNEGTSIALALEETWTPRPMTHDLMIAIFQQLRVSIDRVVITDLKENTFYAVLHLTVDGKQLAVDSRPSDAIALALRVQRPVYLSTSLAWKMGDELDELFDRMQPNDTVH